MFDYIKSKMTPSQVSKLYTDHYESMIAAGIEFNETDFRNAWAEAERTARQNEVNNG